MDIKQVCFCVLFLSLNLVCCQYSPCPSVFDFESVGGNIYGKIVLQPSAPVSSLVLRINFTIAAQLISTYVGRIEAEDGNLLLQNYNRGYPATFRVHFPVTSPLPKLTALTVNGEILCYGPGDVAKPNSYVTTLSLQHTSFLRGGGPVYTNFQQQPQPLPRPDPTLNLIGEFGDDAQAQVFTFSNVEPSWSPGNTIYIMNNTRPFAQPTQPIYTEPTQAVYQQPNRPIYDQTEYDQDRTPVFEERPTKRPLYERPLTRPPPPSRPNVEDSYYPDRVTANPRPVTKKPVNRQPPIAANTECGIVSGGNDMAIPLIYNGNSYIRGDIPWLTAIYKTSGGTLTFICGGTLVSNRHVITAAHCMQRRAELTSIRDFVVKVGVHNLNDWSDDISVTRTLMSAAIHESYNASTLENDILVFTFDKRVEFNTYIRPACLWGGNSDLSRIVGASGVVAGWGDQGAGGMGKQGEPHMVRIPIVSTAVCRASKPQFHKLTSTNTLCAGDRKGAGPCTGDSGGGLYLLDSGKWRLRGIVSVSLRPENGDSTCNLNEYIIFTDTAQYLTWIRSIISENYYD